MRSRDHFRYGSIYKNGHYLPEIESGYRLTSKVYELIVWINKLMYKILRNEKISEILITEKSLRKKLIVVVSSINFIIQKFKNFLQ